MAFLNTPDADANTPITAPGFVASIGFFGHEGHHGESVAWLGAGVPAKRVAGAEPITLTLVPVSYPTRAMTAQDVQVKATLQLLASKVEKLR